MACGLAVSSFVISCNSGAKKEAPAAEEAEKAAPAVEEVAAPNTLTEKEKADGWVLLFDGEKADGWRGYNGLVDVGYSKHFRVYHGDNEFANGNRHINGIESFWSYAKRRLIKFNGVSKRTFYLHLKETEF